MTVAQVGYTQAEYVEDGGQAIAWPSGAAAAHTGVVWTATGSGGKPKSLLPAGWQLLKSNSAGEAIWGKLSLTATDIADDLDVNGVVAGLAVFSGVLGFGASTAKPGATTVAVGDGIFTFGRKSDESPALTPPDGRINATDAINDHFTKKRISAKKTKWVGRRYNSWLTVPSVVGYTEIATNAEPSSLMSVVLRSTSDAGTTTPSAIDLLNPTDGAVVPLGTSYVFSWASDTYYTGGTSS